jgi:glucuronosyltransferase
LEAITRDIPLVGIPVFFDQKLNIARAVLAGYGLKIDFNNVTTESLTWAIQEAIGSTKYVALFSSLKIFIFACKCDFSNNQ